MRARDNLSMSRERTGLAFGQTARRWPTLPQMSQLLPLEGHVRARWPALPQTLQVFELATILLSRCGELGVMSRLRLVAAGAACGARVSEQRAGGAADQGGRWGAAAAMRPFSESRGGDGAPGSCCRFCPFVRADSSIDSPHSRRRSSSGGALNTVSASSGSHEPLLVSADEQHAGRRR